MDHTALSPDRLTALREAMTTYFIDEKWESALFITVGALALVLGFVLWRGDGAYKAAAWPLAAIAVIQIAVGAAIFNRTDEQLSALYQQADEAAAQYQQDETARMAKVMTNFRIYKGIEILLMIVGLALTMFMRENMAAYAAGVGLFGQAALLMLLDLIAEKRAEVYLGAIRDAFS